MLKDVVRAILVCVVMSVGAGLIIEVRHRLAVIDIASRMSVPPQYVQQAPAPARPLERVGRSALELADSVISIVR
jgi:hypothetical protein